MLEQEDAVSLVSTTGQSKLWLLAGCSIVLWDHELGPATTFDQEVGCVMFLGVVMIEFIWLGRWSFTTFLYIV
ncbi:hypothetical protein BKA70DRAFT_1402946, partial [Coprinopsis sp. MPI-PUGE-AT-0042]